MNQRDQFNVKCGDLTPNFVTLALWLIMAPLQGGHNHEHGCFIKQRF